MELVKTLCQQLEAEVPAYKELTASLRSDPNVICLKARLKEEKDEDARSGLVGSCYDLIVSRITEESRMTDLFLESASKVCNDVESGILTMDQAMELVSMS